MINQIKKRIRNTPYYWRYVQNKKATQAYSGSKLSKIVDELKVSGIAMGSFEDLIPELSFESFQTEIFREVQNYTTEMKDPHQDQLKPYFHFVLGQNPVYEKESLWNKIASNKSFQEISDAYFEMKNTEMRYYNIWKHEPSPSSRSGSQFWHRDREDLKILKIFICIEDVTEFNGPFTYAPCTHLNGKIKKEPENFIEEGGNRRTTDEMMKKVVPSENGIKAIGKKGQIIFADTHGFHKGGEVERGKRVLFTAMYVSPSCGRRYFK